MFPTLWLCLTLSVPTPAVAEAAVEAPPAATPAAPAETAGLRREVRRLKATAERLEQRIAALEGRLAETTPSGPAESAPSAAPWDRLGVRLEPIDPTDLTGTKYRGGLRVVALRDDRPAAVAGLKVGDVLVGLGQWETVAAANVEWVLGQPETEPLKFYVVRGRETLFGHFHDRRS